MAGPGADTDGKEFKDASGSNSEDAERPSCHAQDGASSADTIKELKKSPRRITLYKFLRLMAYFWTQLCCGFSNEVFGPSLPDLTKRLGVNYKKISYALTARDAGFCFGSVVAGLSLGPLQQHSGAIIAFCLVNASLMLGVIPISSQLWVIITIFGIFGFSRGISGIGLNNEVIRLFEADASSPLHALSFGYSLGSLISPQIFKHFWSRQNIFNLTDITFNQTLDEAEARIEIPYSISAGFALSSGILIMCFHIYDKCHMTCEVVSTKVKTSLKKSISPAACSKGNTVLSGMILGLLTIYFFTSFGIEKVFSQFLYSFAVETEVAFTSDAASLLLTTFWVCATCGRLTCMLLSICLGPRYTLGMQCAVMIISSTLLTLYGHRVPMALWVCTCLSGIASTVATGNGMAWANQNLNLNAVAIMLFFIAGGIGITSLLYIVGTFFDEHPNYLGYVIMADVGVSSVCFILMEVFAWQQKK